MRTFVGCEVRCEACDVRGLGMDLREVGGYEGEAVREATRLGSTEGGV